MHCAHSFTTFSSKWEWFCHYFGRDEFYNCLRFVCVKQCEILRVLWHRRRMRVKRQRVMVWKAFAMNLTEMKYGWLSGCWIIASVKYISLFIMFTLHGTFAAPRQSSHLIKLRIHNVRVLRKLRNVSQVPGMMYIVYSALNPKFVIAHYSSWMWNQLIIIYSCLTFISQ